MRQPPLARQEIVEETLHGITIADPYRWMEDWHSQELQDYVRAEGAYAREYLDALPRRQELYEHLQAANVTALKTFAPQMILAGNMLFALRLFTEMAVPVLVVHDADQVEARPRILYDPNTD